MGSETVLPQSTPVATLADTATGHTGVTNLHERAEAARNAAITNLITQQQPEGHWCAELEGDSILQSEYILLKWIIEQEDDPRLPKIANYLRSQQRSADGAWVQYPGAKPDLSATAKACFALKLMGNDTNAPHMARPVSWFSTLAVLKSATPTHASIWRTWARCITTTSPRCPRRWCCCHAGFISTWTRSAPGHAP